MEATIGQPGLGSRKTSSLSDPQSDLFFSFDKPVGSVDPTLHDHDPAAAVAVMADGCVTTAAATGCIMATGTTGSAAGCAAVTM